MERPVPSSTEAVCPWTDNPPQPSRAAAVTKPERVGLRRRMPLVSSKKPAAQGGSGSGAYAESWGGGSGSRELRTDAISISHNHTLDVDTQSSGGGEAVDMMPPYLAVYVWQRLS